MLILFITILPTSTYGQDVVKLDVEEAIKRAIDNSTAIYSIEKNIPTLDEALRKSKFGSDSSKLMLHKYKAYVDMYNSGKFMKYSNMSSGELSSAYANLFVKRSNALTPSLISTTYYTDLVEEIEFIDYIYMFGSEKPLLTDEKVYKDFKKNEVFATVTAEFEKEKLLASVESVKNSISTNISNLYKGALDYKFNIDIQKSLLINKKANLDVLKKNYELGLLSELAYERERVIYESAILEYENLILQYTNYEAQLKNQIKVPLGDTLILVDDFSKRYKNQSMSLASLIDTAKNSNVTLSNLRRELDIKKRKVELFRKYITNENDKEFVDLSFDIAQLEKNIKKEEALIESNLMYALGDLASKEINIESSKNASDISNALYRDANEKNELGLLSDIQLSELRLDMETKALTINIKERELENAKYLLDKLVNYGVKY